MNPRRSIAQCSAAGSRKLRNLSGPMIRKLTKLPNLIQPLGMAEQFGAPRGSKLTSHHPKLTSGAAQQPNPRVQAVGAPLHSTDACTSDEAPQQ
jgi:hypothetical protein